MSTIRSYFKYRRKWSKWREVSFQGNYESRIFLASLGLFLSQLMQILHTHRFLKRLLKRVAHEGSGPENFVVSSCLCYFFYLNWILVLNPQHYQRVPWIQLCRLSFRPSVCNAFLSGLAHSIFLILCMELGFSKQKNKEDSFWEKFFLCPNGVNRAFMGSKSTLLNFSPNLLIRFFWDFTWRYALKRS